MCFREMVTTLMTTRAFQRSSTPTDNNTILAGHGFVEAARLAGLARVSVIRFSHLTETQKRAYLLADNRIAEQAGWDREILAIELGELSELMPVEGFDVSLTGFQTAEIDLLLADMAQAKQEPEDADLAVAGESSDATRRFMAARQTPSAMRRRATF